MYVQGNLFYTKLYTVEKFKLGHVVVQHSRLNYITNALTRMRTSLTDHVTLSISKPEKLLMQLPYRFARMASIENTLKIESPPSEKHQWKSFHYTNLRLVCESVCP